MIEYASMEKERVILKHDASNYETLVVSFLRDAIQEEAHLIKPLYVSEDGWMRQRNVGGIYIGSPAIYEDLTKFAGLHSVPPKRRRVTTEQKEVTTEWVRQIVKNFLMNLRNNCSPEVQDRYSLNELLAARKPLSQKSREKHSRVWRRISLRVEEQVERSV